MITRLLHTIKWKRRILLGRESPIYVRIVNMSELVNGVS